MFVDISSLFPVRFNSFCFYDSFLGRIVNVAGFTDNRVHAGDLILFSLGAERHFETIMCETSTKCGRLGRYA